MKISNFETEQLCNVATMKISNFVTEQLCNVETMKLATLYLYPFCSFAEPNPQHPSWKGIQITVGYSVWICLFNFLEQI
jgi:hypothetical protein